MANYDETLELGGNPDDGMGPTEIPPEQSRRNGRRRHARRPRRGHTERVDLPIDRRGRFTSVLGVLIMLAGIALIVANFLIPSESQAEGIVRATLVTAVTLVLSVLSVAIGLRSASKPKGHVGRGRGLVTVLISSILPVVAFSVMILETYGMAKTVMQSGIVMHVIDRETKESSLVSPLGTLAITERDHLILEKLDLMPANTIYDDEDVSVESKDGSLSIGGETVESDSEMVDSIAEGVATAQANGYEVSLGADGKIRGQDENGNLVTISMTGDGVNIHTDSHLTLDELISKGSQLLGANRLLGNKTKTTKTPTANTTTTTAPTNTTATVG